MPVCLPSLVMLLKRIQMSTPFSSWKGETKIIPGRVYKNCDSSSKLSLENVKDCRCTSLIPFWLNEIYDLEAALPGVESIFCVTIEASNPRSETISIKFSTDVLEGE